MEERLGSHEAELEEYLPKGKRRGGLTQERASLRTVVCGTDGRLQTRARAQGFTIQRLNDRTDPPCVKALSKLLRWLILKIKPLLPI